ncbi:Protein HIM-4 d, partial [Aphelenchoides avenae]
GQGLEISAATAEDSGVWNCVAENDAGTHEIEIVLDVWAEPHAYVHAPEGSSKPLGGSVTLFCNATGNPTPALSWSYGGRQIVPSPDGIRITPKGNRLDIPRLELSDAGEYTCVAKNEVSRAEASIIVEVLVPPGIERDGIDLNPRIPTGKPLRLSCDVKGKPPPAVRWYINDTLVDESFENVVLGPDWIEVFNVSLADKGIYKCAAENAAGSDEVAFKVDVNQAPGILRTGQHTFKVEEGKVGVLDCGAAGEPRPKITWLRNGIILETGTRYLLDGSTLKILDAHSVDSGIYLCEAINEAGSDQQAYTLEVIVAPKIVTASANDTLVSAGSPISLQCGAGGYPHPTIRWLLNDEPLHVMLNETDYTLKEKNSSLTVHSAQQNGAMTFRCVVENDAGMDEAEFVVRTI